MDKLLGFLLVALPAATSFTVYGTTKDKVHPLVGALLAGAAYAATDIAGSRLAGGGFAGLSMERVGKLVLNPMARSMPALTAAQRGNLGYLVPQKVGACFGTC